MVSFVLQESQLEADSVSETVYRSITQINKAGPRRRSRHQLRHKRTAGLQRGQERFKLYIVQ